MKAHERIEEFIDNDQWGPARRLIRRALKQDPDDHWLLSRLALTYYEEHRYEDAVELSQRAVKQAPDCPLALWDLAGALEMVDRQMEAIAIWRKLIRRGVNSLAFGECGEGIRWAKSLLNDCRYRVGRCYRTLGRRSLARKYLQQHLDSRQRGLPSSYTIGDARRELNRVGSKD